MDSIDPDELRLYVKSHPEANLQKLANHFNCSITKVRNAIKRYGIAYVSNQRKSATAPQPEELQRYIDKHPDYTLQQIGGHFSCTGSAIGDIIRRYKLIYSQKRGMNHKGNPKLSPEELHGYIAKHPGANQCQIASHFGCHRDTIKNTLKRHQIPYSKKVALNGSEKVNPKKLRAYISTHPEDNISKIAKHFASSQFIISSIIKRHGIPYTKKFGGKAAAGALPPDKVREYIRLHPQETLREIAAHFDRSSSCIGVIIKKHDIPYSSSDYKAILRIAKINDFLHDHPFAGVSETEKILRMPYNTFLKSLRSEGFIDRRNRWRIEAVEKYIRENPGADAASIAGYFCYHLPSMHRFLNKHGIKL
jgi:transposase